MKNLPLIIIGAIIIIGLAVGGWMFLGKGKPVSGPTQVGEEISTETPAPEEGFTGKIKEAILRGVPMKCTYSDEKGNSYTGYIRGKNFYVELAGGGKTGYLIMKDDCMWTWNKGETQGIKMCFEPTEGEESIWETESAPQENYTCTPTVVADSLFNPPANINFMELGEGIPTGVEE